jgi:hypothetical protein
MGNASLCVAEGHCVRPAADSAGEDAESAWRVYHGPVRPGGARPVLLTAVPARGGKEYE